MLHDLMAESILGLISFVQDKLDDRAPIESVDRVVMTAPALLDRPARGDVARTLRLGRRRPPPAASRSPRTTRRSRSR
jgi:hypothetical protein